MAAARRLFAAADAIKKDDDLRSDSHGGLGSLLQSLRTLRRRRILYALLASWLLYLFIKNLPTDLAPVAHRHDKYGPQRQSNPPAATLKQDTEIDGIHEQTHHPIQYADEEYEGPIKFYKLAQSLRNLAFSYRRPDAVLFAFSSLKSSSVVVPSACAMAYQNNTEVHVAMMGRQHVEREDILMLNGIHEQDCPIIWHDAQPDHAQESSEARLQISIEAAIGHIHTYVPLQAIFYDITHAEDNYLRTAVSSKAHHSWLPAIPVPSRDAWMLMLDGYSLRQWHTVSVDIVIRVEEESSASVMRLLYSLQRADYRGLVHPKIILELPLRVDEALIAYLAAFQWPPDASPPERMLVVRRHVSDGSDGTLADGLSTLESFYPSTALSNVLVLSSNAEVGPNYYHILVYMLLEYKYGARHAAASDKLMGLSLMGSPQTEVDYRGPVILSQAVAEEAVLFFGDKWYELQHFVTARLGVDPEWKESVPSTVERQGNPAWLKGVSELMKVQTYFILHPVLHKNSSPLVTVHSELSRDTEISRPSNASPTGSKQEISMLTEESGTLFLDFRPRQDQGRTMLTAVSVSSVFHRADDSDATIVILDAQNKRVTLDEAAKQSSVYRERFSAQVGRCSSNSHREGEPDSIEYLFCK